MASDSVVENELVDAVRRRIAAIYDELARLPRDAFAQRSSLVAERGMLTDQLRMADANEATSSEWAERSARKPGEATRPPIPSHSEGGGGSVG
jgi:hypothetical protein